MNSTTTDDGGATYSQNSTNYHAVGIILLVLAPFVGAMFPSLFKNYEGTLHFLTAYAGGVLFGFALLHTLPDAINGVPPIDSIQPGYPIATLLVGCTLLLLLFIANFVEYISIFILKEIKSFENVELSPTVVDVLGFWPGLSIHGIFEGLAWGIGVGATSDWIALTVLFFHKCVEFDALGSLLIRNNPQGIIYWSLNIICELPCIISFIVAWRITSSSDEGTDGYFAAFGTGTFLYLSLGHLIPDVFCGPSSTSTSSSGHICSHGHLHHVAESNEASSKTPLELEAAVSGQDESMQTTSLEIHQDDVSPTAETNSTMLYWKLRAFIGVGFGFASFALLELYPT